MVKEIEIKFDNSKRPSSEATRKNIEHKKADEKLVLEELEGTRTEKRERSSLKQPKRAFEKKSIILLIIGIVAFLAGLGCLLFALFRPTTERETSDYPTIPSTVSKDSNYSLLTGEVLAEGADKNAPVFCIQTPNGMDGARPQSGLTEAGVVFEAIAEAGITRFAAIYQNPESAVIGPIRSLRMYYLEWDTPFDCTIVHAGGANDALAAVSSGGYRNFDENYQYMYRGTYSGRLWNNLFTTSNYLKKFNSDHGYNSSNLKGFKRMTPEESNKKRANKLGEELDITVPTNKDTSALNAEVSSLKFRFGGTPNFNVTYNYDIETNTYHRGYESGVSHDVFECAHEDLGEKNPEDVCSLTTLSPSVVIAMIVRESRAADGYHESITTIGSGDAYIFQNGEAIKGTWNKASKEDQIKFFDGEGNELALAPGQTIISAVPNYGSVEY